MNNSNNYNGGINQEQAIRKSYHQHKTHQMKNYSKIGVKPDAYHIV